MKLIQYLTEKIEEETRDSENYIEEAIRIKSEHPETASVLAKLSDEENQHAIKLHEAAESLIKEHRAKVGAPPSDMMVIYNYLHERYIDNAKEVRVLHDMYSR